MVLDRPNEITRTCLKFNVRGDAYECIRAVCILNSSLCPIQILRAATNRTMEGATSYSVCIPLNTRIRYQVRNNTIGYQPSSDQINSKRQRYRFIKFRRPNILHRFRSLRGDGLLHSDRHGSILWRGTATRQIGRLRPSFGRDSKTGRAKKLFINPMIVERRLSRPRYRSIDLNTSFTELRVAILNHGNKVTL